MPGVARMGIDVAGGIGIEGSPNVFANSAPVMRLGDKVAAHGPPPHTPPPSMIAVNPNVYANGILIVVQGNLATCQHPITGSPDVFCG
jgi:uncharacterized Zn-binding protein involved in type VI secretion